MPGRPRKPAAIKRLEGNPGKKKIPPEPAYSAELPDPPSFLADVGLEEWRRLAPVMVAQGVLTSADWVVFSSYCHAVQRSWNLRHVLELEQDPEEWHKTDRALDRVEKQLVVAYRELGLSPVTRSKAAIEKPKKVDKFAKFEVVPGGKK